MKILITGATGFLGKHILHYLSKLNIELLCTHLPNENISELDNYKNCSWFSYDLTSTAKSNLFSFFHKPDAIIHLAWSGLSNFKSRTHIDENLVNHESFIKNLVENGLKNVTVIGTCQEYGMQNGVLHESMPTLPNTYYAIAKDTLNKLIQQLHNQYSFSYKWIRLFYMYGEGQNEKSLIPQLLKAIENNEKVFNMSPGDQIRDYLPVEKVAEYISKIAMQTAVGGAINCCSGKPVSVRSLVEQIIEAHKSNIQLNGGYYPYPDYEPFAFWGDNSKLLQILNPDK